jgi:hypothetical protein
MTLLLLARPSWLRPESSASASMTLLLLARPSWLRPESSASSASASSAFASRWRKAFSACPATKAIHFLLFTQSDCSTANVVSPHPSAKVAEQIPERVAQAVGQVAYEAPLHVRQGVRDEFVAAVTVELDHEVSNHPKGDEAEQGPQGRFACCTDTSEGWQARRVRRVVAFAGGGASSCGFGTWIWLEARGAVWIRLDGGGGGVADEFGVVVAWRQIPRVDAGTGSSTEIVEGAPYVPENENNTFWLADIKSSGIFLPDAGLRGRGHRAHCRIMRGRHFGSWKRSSRRDGGCLCAGKGAVALDHC